MTLYDMWIAKAWTKSIQKQLTQMPAFCFKSYSTTSPNLRYKATIGDLQNLLRRTWALKKLSVTWQIRQRMHWKLTNIENLTSKAKTTTLGISRLLNSMSGWQMRSANSHVCQPQIRTCEEKTFQLFCAEFFESSWRAKWRILSAPSPPDPLREGLYMPDKISQRAESQRVCPNTSLVIFPKTIVTKTGTSNYILDMNIFCSNTQQTISTVTSRLQGWLFCWKCWGSLLSHLNLVPVQRLGPAPAESAADPLLVPLHFSKFHGKETVKGTSKVEKRANTRKQQRGGMEGSDTSGVLPSLQAILSSPPA